MFVAYKTLLITLLLLSAVHSATASERGLHRNVLSAVTNNGQSIQLYEQSHALLIGVSDYTDGWSDLEAIPEELDAVEDALVAKGFNVVRVRNPDSRQMKAAFEDFINDYGHDPNNRLLFFYSGHGHSDKRRGYLVPTDAPLEEFSPKDFRRRSLDMDQILAWARKIDAKHALFLFDSCFSGSIFKAKNMPSAKDRLITGATNQAVRQFITAGSAGETVPARSTFTPAFVRAISEGKGDINNDGYITGSELGFHLSQIVPEFVDQTPQYGKIRDWELQKGDFVFINNMTIQAAQSDAKVGDASAIEVTYWKSAEKQGSLSAYELYLNKFPDGEFKELAQLQISTLKLEEDREQQAQAAKIEQELTQKHEQVALEADEILWDRSLSLATTAGLKQYVETCQAPCQKKNEAIQLLDNISQNKRAFSRHLKNNELTTGEQGTALQSVLAVESIVPGDIWIDASKEVLSERYSDLAENHILAKRFSEARGILQKANEISPTDRVGSLFALLQQEEGQAELATQEKLNKASESNPLPEKLAPLEAENITKLSVAARPSDSVIKILNIKPKYKNGIALETGVNYRIHVSKLGYKAYDKYHKFAAGSQNLSITLQPNTPVVKKSSIKESKKIAKKITPSKETVAKQKAYIELISAATSIITKPYVPPKLFRSNTPIRKSLKSAYAKLKEANKAKPGDLEVAFLFEALDKKYSTIVNRLLADDDLKDAKKFLDDSASLNFYTKHVAKANERYIQAMQKKSGKEGRVKFNNFGSF